MNRTTLKIDGMSCGHCVMTVKNALESLDGVIVESVAVGSAAVQYDPAVASARQIVDVVRGAGYSVALAA